jgi:hypothetical protein
MNKQLVMNHTAAIPAIDGHNDPLVFFCERLTGAVQELTHRLQAQYERIHPDQSELIRHVIAEAEAKAWELSFFPHLFLPDLVEARLAELTLQPAFARSGVAFAYAA